MMTENEPCYQSTFKVKNEFQQKLKEKRAKTIKSKLTNKVYEENGQDLLAEYGTLVGIQSKEYSEVLKTSQVNKLKDNKCSDIINQNEAVNLENVRNQDDIGWCYAYTAADLLSFRLKQKVSAISLFDSRQTVAEDINDFGGTGGNIGESITNYLLKNKGLCLESDLPSSDFKFCTYQNYKMFLNSLYQSISAGNLSESICLQQNLNSAFPGANTSLINNYVKIHGSTNLAEFLFKNQCPHNKIIDFKTTPITLLTPPEKTLDLISKTDQLLNNGEVIGLAYKPNIMNENQKATSGHASLIVGRRKNPKTGDCEYLIRDSHGKDCTQNEGQGLTCHKNCDQHGDNCRYSGNFWVDQRRLKNSILGITYLP
jgi:hypothetical protein